MCDNWRYSWFPIQRHLGLDPLSVLTPWHKAAMWRVPQQSGKFVFHSVPNLYLTHISYHGKGTAGMSGKSPCVKSPGCQGCSATRYIDHPNPIWTPSQYWSPCAKGWLSDPRAREVLLHLSVWWSDRLEVSSPMPSSKKKTKIKRLLAH